MSLKHLLKIRILKDRPPKHSFGDVARYHKSKVEKLHYTRSHQTEVSNSEY
jgi:hypothetical protein